MHVFLRLWLWCIHLQPHRQFPRLECHARGRGLEKGCGRCVCWAGGGGGGASITTKKQKKRFLEVAVMLFGMKRVECEKAMRKRLQMQPPPPFPMYFEYRWLVAHGHINFNSKLKYYLNVQCCRQNKTFVQMFSSVVKIRHYLDIWMFSSVMNIRHYFRCLGTILDV